MIRFVRSASILVLGSALTLALGCGSGGGSSSGGAGSSTGSDSGATTGSGNGTTTGSGASCAMMCSSGQDCQNLACSCGDGSVINTTACNNACCATAAEACPDSCKDNGGWGSGSGASTGSGQSGAAFGEDCASNADCQSGICFHVNTNDDTVQKCTKACTFGGGECGAGWDCAEITNAGDTTYLCILH
jgi:hypothetical protein